MTDLPDTRCKDLLFMFRDSGRREYGPRYAENLARNYGIPAYGGHCECPGCDRFWASLLAVGLVGSRAPHQESGT